MKTTTVGREETVVGEPRPKGLLPTPTQEFETFADALDFGIEEKTTVCDFYRGMAQTTALPSTKKAFQMIAEEKFKQKEHLLWVKRDWYLKYVPENVPSLKIADYVTAEVLPREDMDTREVFIFAIRVERDALRLYTDLADNARNAETQGVFLALGQEQARFLLKLETEYERYFFARY